MGKITYSDGSTPKICIIGAGFSGLTAGIKLKKELKLETFSIFDENEDVGGTWLVNKYPGCACDVQSHLYSWSFNPNPNWSKSYSSQPEIWEYIRKTASKYDLYPHITFNTQIVRVTWDESINKWKVILNNKITKKETEILFDIVISGAGALRVPSYPKEFTSFTAPKLHTAEWDPSVDLSSKRVGIVGSGASAVQVITELSPIVKEMHCYQRKPAWISPRAQYDYAPWVQTLFRILPIFMWIYRASIYLTNELRHNFFIYKSWASGLAKWVVLKHLKKQLPDPSKLSALTPKYDFGCKRVVKSSDYYPALSAPHVKIHTDPITQVGPNFITTKEGGKIELDFLVLATGFKVQDFFDPLVVIGTQGTNVMDKWKKEGPISYYGITSSFMPNMFMLLGPNTGLGHNSIIFIIECQADFTISCIREMMRRDVKKFTIKKSAESEFMNGLETKMNETVWANGKCDSWYQNERGKITTLWPWNCTTYWKRTKKVDFTHFDLN